MIFKKRIIYSVCLIDKELEAGDLLEIIDSKLCSLPLFIPLQTTTAAATQFCNIIIKKNKSEKHWKFNN